MTSKILLQDFIPTNQRPDIIVDPHLKRDFSESKLVSAEERALSLVDDLPNSRTGIKVQVEGYFQKEFKDTMSFGLGIFGKKKQLSLIVSFSGEKPVFKLMSIARPDFGLNSTVKKVE